MTKTTVKYMTQLRSQTTDQLLQNNEDLRSELFALKFQAAVGSLEKTHRIKELKKEIARVSLVLGEKRRLGEDINKTKKANYSKAVEAAEKAGKELRKKHLAKLEELQNLQNSESKLDLDKEVVEKSGKKGVDE